MREALHVLSGRSMCLACLMEGGVDAVSMEDLKEIEKSLCQLRELLTNALPDDLLDDDTASFSSHESNGSVSDRRDSFASPSHDPWSHLRHQVPGHHKLIQQQQQQQQQTSTPNEFGHPPPLKTPAPMPYQNGYGGHRGHGQLQNRQQFLGSSDDETLGQQYERGEIEGAANDEPLNSETGHQYPGPAQQGVGTHGNRGQLPSDGYTQGNLQQGNQLATHGYRGHGDHGDYPATNEYQDDGSDADYAHEDPPHENGFEGESLPIGDYEYRDQSYETQVQQYSPSRRFPHQHSPDRHHGNGDNQRALHHGRNTQAYAGSRHHDSNPSNNNPAIHRVEYRGDGATAPSGQPAEPVHRGMPPSGGFPPGTSQAPVGYRPQDAAGDQLQKQFLGVGGDQETRQMAQLQILYKARGRELDQLGKQLQVLKEESGRDKRILSHQLALAQGERAGAVASYEQSQQLLAERQQDNTKLTGHLQAAQAQIQALNAAKHEVEEKLQSTESAIESLTGQLSELQRSQPLARAREQQDGLLKSLQERFQEEVTRLTEKVDRGESSLEEKGAEIDGLRRELARVTKASELAKLEHGNTVNALTSQLQSSQKQCRDLLETGSLQEINLLRVQLQEASAARTFSQDMTSALQEELTEMKEQLQMYESAMDLGVVATKSPEPSHQSKFFAVRNLAKSDWKTPQSTRSSSDAQAPKLSPEALVEGLRKELERSLQSNRAKRGQVSKLQADLRAAKAEAEGVKSKLRDLESTAKDREVRFSVLEAQLETMKASPTAERPTSRHLQGEMDKLLAERESTRNTLEELRAEEGRLNQANSDLKKQMAQMVTEWDQDKKIDLERVQKTCLQLHEDSSRHLREELVAEFQSERDMLKEAQQHQLSEVRSELEQAQKELDAVKGLYVDVCEEKNKIEDAVTKTMSANADRQLEAAKEAWQAQHEAAVKELRDSLESSHRAELVLAKSSWRQEAEEENRKTVEEQVAIAKAEWTEAARKEFAESTTLTEAERRVKMETELKQRIDRAEKDLEASHQENLSRLEQRLQSEHETDKAGAVLAAVAKAKTEWTKAAEASTKEKLRTAIEMARQQWTREDPDARLEEAVAAARRQWTDEKVDWGKVKEEWMRDKGEEEITKRVADKTKVLEAKHLRDIAGLQAILEQGRQQTEQEAGRDRAAAVEEARAAMAEEHRRVTEEVLRDARAEAEKDKCQSLERMASDWQSRLDEEMVSRQDAVSKALQEARHQWQQEKQDMLKAHQAAVTSQRDEATAEMEELRSQYEAELERGIEEAVRSAREQWSKNSDAEARTARDELVARREQSWSQERDDLRERLAEAAAQLAGQQRQAERRSRRQAAARQQLEQQAASLRERLQDADRELRQTEYGLRRELEQLRGRLAGANAAAVQGLEAEMAGQRRQHQEELAAARRERGGGKERTVDAETQSVAENDGSVSGEAMQEIKAHYIRTVKKIKVDVMKRMSDMRENCRHTVHSEVLKERHNTAKTLRRYYLQCLQKLLEEEEEEKNRTGSSRTRDKSTASKLAAMAKALELSPELSPDQLASKLPQPAEGGPSGSREKDPGPSRSARSEYRSSRAVAEMITEDRRHPRPNSGAAGALSTEVGNPLVSADSENSSYPAPGLRDLADDRDVAPARSDGSADGFESGRSSDEFALTSSGGSWEELEAGTALGKLPVRPREFNPKPERLASAGRGRAADQPFLTASSISTGSLSSRSRDSSPDNSSCGPRRVVSNSSGRPATLKSRESCPDTSPVAVLDKGHSKNPDGFSKATHRHIKSNSLKTSATVKSRESSPESSVQQSPRSRFPTKNSSAAAPKSSSNITVRSRRHDTPSAIGHVGSAPQRSPFERPIAGHKRSADPRKGPVRVPPPTERTAAMLATVSSPAPRGTRHADAPSLGPYKATDISSGSLDTVYNDLPASLGAVPDFPLDSPRRFPPDKVVRFDDLPAKGSYAKKSQIELENARTKRGGITGSQKLDGVPTLPSSSSSGSRKQTLRSTEKLGYLLRQDSGFESPQLEEQIAV